MTACSDPYSMARPSYDLGPLACHGLITRRPQANTYDLIPDGLKLTIFYTKVHDRVLAPLFAAGGARVIASLRVIVRHCSSRPHGCRLAGLCQ